MDNDLDSFIVTRLRPETGLAGFFPTTIFYDFFVGRKIRRMEDFNKAHVYLIDYIERHESNQYYDREIDEAKRRLEILNVYGLKAYNHRVKHYTLTGQHRGGHPMY